MSTVAQALAQWVHDLALPAIGDDVVRQAVRCIVDVTGVALAGTSHPTSQAVRTLAQAEAAPGRSTVWGASVPPLTASAAALCNATAAHALDYDDTCYDGIVHASAAVWPAVLACADDASASGARALEAFIAGVETEYALGRALSDEAYFRGWWMSGVLGAIGAAAGAAKLYALDCVQTGHAISLAACQATGLRAMFGTAAKPYALGRAAQAGVQAAHFARAGLDAPADAFGGERGFIRVLAQGEFDVNELAPGRRYSLLQPGVAFKLYAACSATQAATEAVIELVVANAVHPDDMSSVTCEVTPLVAVSLMYPQPENVAQAQFSLPYAIACALRYRHFGLRQITEPSFSEPAMQALMRRVRMIRNDRLEATEAGRRENPEGARVVLTLRDGRVLERYKGAATGMPQVPMSEEVLERKFIECASTGVPDARALLHKLRALAECRDVRSLWH